MWPDRIRPAWGRFSHRDNRAIFRCIFLGKLAEVNQKLPRDPTYPPGTAMSRTIGRLRYLYLAYLSRPDSERALYRAIRRQRARSILELGIGGGQRARRMIEVAQFCHPREQVRYAGIDAFEARSSDAPAGLTLKQAHQLLKATAARIQLIPGDPYSALARTANALGALDVIVIAADLSDEQLQRAWFYVPRLLHAGSQIWRERLDAASGRSVFQPLARATIETLAKATRPRQVA
jgi:hypothetical protein